MNRRRLSFLVERTARLFRKFNSAMSKRAAQEIIDVESNKRQRMVLENFIPLDIWIHCLVPSITATIFESTTHEVMALTIVLRARSKEEAKKLDLKAKKQRIIKNSFAESIRAIFRLAQTSKSNYALFSTSHEILCIIFCNVFNQIPNIYDATWLGLTVQSFWNKQNSKNDEYGSYESFWETLTTYFVKGFRFY